MNAQPRYITQQQAKDSLNDALLWSYIDLCCQNYVIG